MIYPEAPWYPLRTPRLVLRAAGPDDHDDVHAYATDAEVVRYMDWGPNTPEITREVLARWRADAAVWPRAGVSLAVEHVEDRRVIGSVRLEVVDPTHRTADFGYTFHRDYWRRGYAVEAGTAVLATAFGVLDLHRVWATCDVRNVGSWRVMEKLGMRREATLRRDRMARDGWRDSHVYAILADEWAAATSGRAVR